MFPGGPSWVAAVLIVVVLAALAFGAWKGREAIRARYLLLVVAVAFVGGVAEKFPFGPAVTNPLSRGERVSLWLLPALAIGLAIALRLVSAALSKRRPLRVVFDVVAYAGAAAIVAVAIAQDHPGHPYPGAEPATAFIERQLAARGAVAILPWPSQYSFAAESDSPAGVRKLTSSHFGFEPTFQDRRVQALPPEASRSDVVNAARGARLVYVYRPDPFNAQELGTSRTIAKALSAAGFRTQRRLGFEDVRVESWRRGSGARRRAAPAATLRPSDLPRGQTPRSASTAPISAQLYRCLRVPVAGTTGASLVAARRGGRLSVTSEAVNWRRAGRAQRAVRAVGGRAGRRCLGSVLLSFGYSGDVEVTRAAPPRRAGGGVAFAVEIRRSKGRARIASGRLVSFVRGPRTGLLLGVQIGAREFPPRLLSNITLRAVSRLEAVNRRR